MSDSKFYGASMIRMVLLSALFSSSCVASAEQTEPVLPKAIPTAQACEDCITRFPHAIHETTVGGANTHQNYSCAPNTDEAGPERTYRVELTEPGVLMASLGHSPKGVDVDVHILATEASDSCIDRGNTRTAAYLEPGEYLVVVDTWRDRSQKERAGEFDLDISFTGVSAFQTKGLSADVLDRALRAYDKAWSQKQVTRTELSIVDFARPASARRFWTVDLSSGSLLNHFYTTHGEGSAKANDEVRAQSFSNIHGSHQSSLGLMKTAEDYYGMWGHSLKLDGLEPHNDQVRPRHIVLHSHEISSEEAVDVYGAVGLSWGCIMLDPNDIDAVIAQLMGGTLIWSDFAGAESIESSEFLTGRSSL